MNFIYLLRLSTSSVIKLVCDVDDGVGVETLYGLTSMTSSSSILPFSSLLSSFL